MHPPSIAESNAGIRRPRPIPPARSPLVHRDARCSRPRRSSAGWPAIAAGADTLILAPTGTGKTLAAFLWELNALITDGLERAARQRGPPPVRLAAQGAQQRRPAQPRAAARAAARSGSRRPARRFPEIRVAVRTGDTPASARARMLRKTPHILITTPESLHILLTSVRGRTMFSGAARRDRRRDPRGGRHQARRAPRAHARAPEPRRARRAAAHRAVGDAAAARRDRAVPRRL